MSAATLTTRRDLLWELIVRNVRLRYRGHVLGLFWTQLGPLVSVVVYTIVFSRLIPLGIPNYALFILIGVEAWQWFQGSLTAGATSIVSNRDLVRHPGFAVSTLPALAVGTQLCFYVFSLPVIVGAIVVATGGFPATAVWLPVLVTLQYVLCLGMAYVLGTLQVFLRDTAEIVGVALRLGFFVTPIIYEEERLRRSAFSFLLDANPMAHLVTAHRDILFFGRSPRLSSLGFVAVVSAVILVAGRIVFARTQHRFPDEI